MKVLNTVVLVSLSLIVANSSASAAALTLPEVKTSICEFLAKEYPAGKKGSHRQNLDLWKYGIEIDVEDCLAANADVTGSDSTTVGSKTYLIDLSVTISTDVWSCRAHAYRSVNVGLSKDDKSVVTETPWSAYEVADADVDPTCAMKASDVIVSLNYEKPPAGVTYTEVKKLPADMFVPEPSDLDEPDDGMAGVSNTVYAVKKDGTLVGYVAEYWVVNDESGSSVRYILKYNASGAFLGHLTEQEDFDFCDFPFSKADLNDFGDECR